MKKLRERLLIVLLAVSAVSGSIFAVQVPSTQTKPVSEQSASPQEKQSKEEKRQEAVPPRAPESKSEQLGRPMPPPPHHHHHQPGEKGAAESGKEKKTFVLDNFKIIATALDALGVDQGELNAYIKDGKKLEDVLTAEKISTRKFKKQLLKAYQGEVEEAVKAGRLTEEQGKQLKTAIKQTVKNWRLKK